MRVVVADATPIRYLAEIDLLDLLLRLFKIIFIPSMVYEELQQPATPPRVRTALKSPPAWLEVVHTDIATDDPVLAVLDKGEKAALMLGLHIHADLISLDDRKGVAAASRKGLESIGTLGILILRHKKSSWTYLMPSHGCGKQDSTTQKRS